MGVYPYQGYRTNGYQPEGDVHFTEHVCVENKANQVKLGGCSQHTREEEEERTGVVSAQPDAGAEVAVNACQVELII